MTGFVTLEEALGQHDAILGTGVVGASPSRADEELAVFDLSEGDAKRLRVFDLHCDTLDRLALSGDPTVPGGFYEHDIAVPRDRMCALGSNDAHVSLSRTARFDWCQCFAIFIPDELRGDEAWSFYLRVRDWFHAALEQERACFDQVRDASGIDSAFAEGKTAGMLTVEGAAFLADDGSAEERLERIARDGVRMMTLTWNGPNAIGSGNLTGEGLTSFGCAMVRELERRDIVMDVSHLNDEGFKDVCRVAQKPFAASHSNSRAMCAHPRNLDDWQLRELSDRGGVVGLNFCRQFLSDTHEDPTCDDVLRHIDHVLEVAGERVLALGSDYDGCDVPSWLDPCDRIGELSDLIAREFGEEIARRVMFENARDFFAR